MELFSAASRPDLVRACQRLRYDVYRRDLGLDTPDMDHVERIDVEDSDPRSDFLAVTRRSDGAVVGCLRMQPSEVGPLYAEKEFVLQGGRWGGLRLVEGARFAVMPAYRDGEVPLRLFAGFRRYCRERRVGHLISVSIVPDAEQRLERALSILRWLADHVRFETSRGSPAPGYDIPALRVADATDAEPADPSSLPAMVRMLATGRTALCAAPAYCRRFRAWSFLFVTDLRRSGGHPTEDA